MRKFFSYPPFIALTVAILMSFHVKATDGFEVIYGDDNIESPTSVENHTLQMAMRSVAARIDATKLLFDGAYFQVKDNVPTIGKRKSLCVNEKFSEDLYLADCTGFLVSKDILLTAGHCARNLSCEQFLWVFDYVENMSTYENPSLFDPKNIYGCKEILNSTEIVYDKKTHKKIDYAFVKLDRPVGGRAPLKVNFKKRLKVGDQVFAVGYPLGSSQKITTGTVVENSNRYYFSATLDVFHGNSGGPVLNAKNFAVEGLVVRGKPDIYLSNPDDTSSCYRINHCDDNAENCNRDSEHLGEEVMRARFFRKVFKKMIRK